MDNLKAIENMSEDERKEFIARIEEDLQGEFVAEIDGEFIIPNVDKFMRLVLRRLKEKRSQVIAVSSVGENGAGKSTLLYWMGREGSKDFGVKRNFFFGRTVDQIKKHILSLGKYDVQLIDEALRLWYKRRAMTSENIDLNEWMGADERKTGVAKVLAIPDFWDLDKMATKSKVNWYIEVLERGVAVIFRPDRFPSADPWHRAELEAIQKSRKNIRVEDLVKKITYLKKHPCYFGLLYWTAMPKSDEKVYLATLAEALAAFKDGSTGSPAEKSYKTLKDGVKGISVELVTFLDKIKPTFWANKAADYGLSLESQNTIRRWAKENFKEEEKQANEDFSKEEKIKPEMEKIEVE